MKTVVGQPDLACGKRTGATLAASLLLAMVLLGFANSGFSQLPLSTGAPYAGQKAPSFALPDQHGKTVSLGDLLKPAGKPGGLVLIFYRGYW